MSQNMVSKSRKLHAGHPKSFVSQSGHSVVISTNDGASPQTFVNERYFSKIITFDKYFESLVVSPLMIDIVNGTISLNDEKHVLSTVGTLFDDLFFRWSQKSA